MLSRISKFIPAPFQWIWISLFLVLLAGCSVNLATSSEFNKGKCDSTFTHGDTFTNRCSMEVSIGTTAIEMNFSARLDEGSLRWTLTDPNGNIVWEEETKSGEPVSKLQVFEKPIPGKWNLALKLTNAKGEYHTEWTPE